MSKSYILSTIKNFILEVVKNHQSKTGGMIMPHFVWFLSTTKTKLFLCCQKFSIFEVLRIPRVIQTTRHRRVEFLHLNYLYLIFCLKHKIPKQLVKYLPILTSPHSSR